MSLLRRKPGPLTVIIDELIAKMIKQDHYSIFAELVSREQYPVYWQTIAEPTAISVMREKNEQGIFRNLDEFKAEFDLMIRNCCTFNPSTSLYHMQAVKLKKYCDPLIAKSAPLVDSSTSFDSGGPLAAQASAPAAEPAYAHTGGSANDDEAASDDGGEASDAPHTASALAGQQSLKRTKLTHGVSISAPSSMRAPPSPQRRLGSSADTVSQSTFHSQPQSHTASQSHSSAPLPPHRGTSINVSHVGDTGSSAPASVQGNRLKRTVTSDAPLRVAEAAMHTNLFTTAAEQSSYWRTSQETRRVQMISIMSGKSKQYTGPPGPISAPDVFTSLVKMTPSSSGASGDSSSSGTPSSDSALLAPLMPTSYPECFARSLVSFLSGTFSSNPPASASASSLSVPAAATIASAVMQRVQKMALRDYQLNMHSTLEWRCAAAAAGVVADSEAAAAPAESASASASQSQSEDPAESQSRSQTPVETPADAAASQPSESVAAPVFVSHTSVPASVPVTTTINDSN